LLSRGFGPEATVGETVMASGSWRSKRNPGRTLSVAKSISYKLH
jgi:hypothetical protein